jgi:outer membrane lipoprotein carrier protein
MFLLPNFFIILAVLLASFFAEAKTTALLKAVEDHYRSAKSAQMDVTKTITLKLLQKEKHSQGNIKIKHGGKLRWETTEPDHTLVVVNPKAVWLVDYPADEDQKVSIIKASHPKKSQPQAIVAFLLGEGRISDSFSVIHEIDEAAASGIVKIELKPTDVEGQFHWLRLIVDKKNKNIQKVLFEDIVGNITELDFKNIEFNFPVDEKIFKFTPPKNAEVTIID